MLQSNGVQRIHHHCVYGRGGEQGQQAQAQPAPPLRQTNTTTTPSAAAAVVSPSPSDESDSSPSQSTAACPELQASQARSARQTMRVRARSEQQRRYRCEPEEEEDDDSSSDVEERPKPKPTAASKDLSRRSLSQIGRTRGAYQCRKCSESTGQYVPKANHDCPFMQHLKKSEEEKEQERRGTKWVRAVSTQCDLSITSNNQSHSKKGMKGARGFQKKLSSAVCVIAAALWA